MVAKELLGSELESVRATTLVEAVAFGILGKMVVVGCGWMAPGIGGTNVGGRKVEVWSCATSRNGGQGIFKT
jgi:hypothetical protein